MINQSKANLTKDMHIFMDKFVQWSLLANYIEDLTDKIM